MEAISTAGQHMSLAALKQHDPYINRIVDVTGQVALYTFNPKANEWEKTDIEGTLFVYTRYATPYHGFTIMNRLNMKNLVEPINKDLEFQLQDPFLLYRNSSLSIYSIWFYDKNDCQRIAQLMSHVVKQEAERAQQGSPGRHTPSKTNGCTEDRPIDILEMLSKAKDEYERTQIGEFDISSSSELLRAHNAFKSSSGEATEHAATSQQQEKNSHPGPKQITVEELFGSSLPKEQSPLGYPNFGTPEKTQQDGLLRRLNLAQPFPYEPSLVSQQGLESLGDSLGAAASTQHETLTHMRQAPALVPLPDIKKLPNSSIRSSPVFQSVHPAEAAGSQILSNLSTDGSDLMKVMQQSHIKPTSPLMVCQPASEQLNPAPHPQSAIPGVIRPPLGSSAISMGFLNQDLLHKLKLTPQHGQLSQQALSKPTLAPNFLSSLSQLATPECFKESISKPVALNCIPATPVQVVPPQVTSVSSAESLLVLLSPSMFQQSTGKPTEPDSKPSSASPLTLAAEAPPSSSVFSRTQLQETLIHLIKNDSKFLSSIHEAYLQVLAKDLCNMKL
ncbi:mRNA-decapping enzyme 1A-like [Acipenser oxyrinchus oxyrinchus]|uniref:5'-(N(7)-methylguanosine 5'-triphospho)-[mRNA] hydrolase n=1 Tax=Acipenser oxyrinchus oxyrinchus TaxID=40147 RepID=A0AAD8CX72_ACIOX|nr:mRNA-decapping enzyme 1A-like [Acipenser oxyrinchus oxyrinchus]